MANYRTIEQVFADHLRTDRRPISVTFRDAPPQGVPRFQGSVPSGCSFWRIAAEGRSFYTVPSDHYNCPIPPKANVLPVAIRAGEMDSHYH